MFAHWTLEYFRNVLIVLHYKIINIVPKSSHRLQHNFFQHLLNIQQPVSGFLARGPWTHREFVDEYHMGVRGLDRIVVLSISKLCQKLDLK